MSSKKRKPLSFYLLVFLMLFLALGGLYGGFGLILRPDGSILQMPLSFLEGTPFINYLIPGIILLFFMGIVPSFLVYPLVAKPYWRWAGIFNIYKDMHWSWTYSLYTGIILVLWMDFQLMIIGYGAVIQTIFSFYGIILVIVSLLPSLKRYYNLKD
jgi:hypothetical protein